VGKTRGKRCGKAGDISTGGATSLLAAGFFTPLGVEVEIKTFNAPLLLFP
jgi:hypothetical protein